MMASMANSSPMRGRARLMLEPVKGLRKVPMGKVNILSRLVNATSPLKSSTW
jgi:hypothetical protein